MKLLPPPRAHALQKASDQKALGPPQAGHEAPVVGVIVSLAIGLITIWAQIPKKPEPAPPSSVGAYPEAVVRPYGPLPHDPGGPVTDYMLKVAAANMRGERIEIRGTCVSACTLFLGARDVCVHGEAMLWFHAARNPETGAIDALGTWAMSAYWGPQITAWAKSVGATETLSFTRRRALSGEEAIRLGVPRCAAPTAS